MSHSKLQTPEIRESRNSLQTSFVVGSKPLLRARSALCNGHDRLDDYVQKPENFQYRVGALYQLVIPALGDQAVLESNCGYFPNETLVDFYHAICDWCSIGGCCLHYPNLLLFPSDPRFLLVNGV